MRGLAPPSGTDAKTRVHVHSRLQQPGIRTNARVHQQAKTMNKPSLHTLLQNFESEQVQRELPAAVLVDAVARLQEGALNDAESAAQDSFEPGPDGMLLLDCPHYTRPVEHPLGSVPEVLLSGNHAAIARWRRQQALGRTWLRRPELVDRQALSRADRALLDEFLAGVDIADNGEKTPL